jgi:hypothetical protein
MDGHLHHHHGRTSAAAHHSRTDTSPPTGGSATASPDLNRLALSATLHCLTGCGSGEVLGMVASTALGCPRSRRRC